MTAKEQGLPELPRAVAYVEVVPAKEGAGYDADVNIWANVPGASHPEGTDGLYTADQMRAYALAALASDTGERGVVAWLHEVTADDGETDQALSFSRDNFPLEGVAGYRKVSVRPLVYGDALPQSSGAVTEAMVEAAGDVYFHGLGSGARPYDWERRFRTAIETALAQGGGNER